MEFSHEVCKTQAITLTNWGYVPLTQQNPSNSHCIFISAYNRSTRNTTLKVLSYNHL